MEETQACEQNELNRVYKEPFPGKILTAPPEIPFTAGGNTMKKETQIGNEFKELDNIINCLEKNMCVLKEILIGSICKEITTPTAGSQKEAEQTLVPVAKNIESFKKRIINVNNRLDNLVSGLEV